MNTTRIVALAALIALALPGAASAAVERIAPPGAAASEGAFRSAAQDDGCRSANAIQFRDTAFGLQHKVLHKGKIRCGLRTQIRCRATLVHLPSMEAISRLEETGRNRCSMGSGFGASDRYSSGEGFEQSYSYRIKLRKKSQRWAGTSDYCPKRKNKRRVLVCKDDFATVAPTNARQTHD